MRNRFFHSVIFAAVVFAGLSPACADPLGLDSTSAEPILPDPLPYTGPAFPAASATAGTADTGPALEVLREDNRSCSALTPCAMPSPALTNSGWNVTAPRSAPAKENPRKSVRDAAPVSKQQ